MNEFTVPSAEPKKWKAVYTIVERDGERKPLWVRIGTANATAGQNERTFSAVAVRATLMA